MPIGSYRFWSAWGPFSSCNTSCGPGYQQRSRLCENGICGMCQDGGAPTDTQPCQIGLLGFFSGLVLRRDKLKLHHRRRSVFIFGLVCMEHMLKLHRQRHINTNSKLHWHMRNTMRHSIAPRLTNMHWKYVFLQLNTFHSQFLYQTHRLVGRLVGMVKLFQDM